MHSQCISWAHRTSDSDRNKHVVVVGEMQLNSLATNSLISDNEIILETGGLFDLLECTQLTCLVTLDCR